MEENKGVTKSSAPTGYRGGTKGSEVTTYDLKAMEPVLVDALGLTRYLREHAIDEVAKEG